MNQTIDFTKTGGLFVYQDTLDFLQDAYQPSIDALVQLFGDRLIVRGCKVTGGNISSGWVVYQNELLPVQGGSLLNYIYIDTAVTPEQFDDGTTKNVYTKKIIRFTSTSGGGNVLWSTFKNMPYNSDTIYDALDTVKSIIQKTVGLEPAVILSGCDVTNIVGSTSGTMDISAGTHLFDGEYVSSSAYSGAFPVYLKSDGSFVTSVPTGTYISFDWGTSQRYADVLKRAIHKTGDVLMNTQNNTRTQYFDAATGLGKWRWLGFKICDALQDRTPLGYDRRSSSGGDANWDANYNTVGNAGGEKAHQLTVDEMPLHTVSGLLKISGSGVDDYDSAGGGHFIRNGTSDPVGNDQPHENRQPYRVILFIERL